MIFVKVKIYVFDKMKVIHYISPGDTEQYISCERSVLGVVPIMVCSVNNPHPYVCPHSIKGLDPYFIRENLPEGVEYDPDFDCGVESCHYRR